MWIAGLVLAGVSVAPAQETECLGDVMCLTRTTVGQTVVFHVENNNPGAITVRFEVDGENIAAPVDFPYVRGFAGGARDTVFSLRPGNRSELMKYRYAYRLVYGRLEAEHDDRYVYALPYAPGTAHEVIQGYNGSFSHRDRYAIDWAMPEGTTVHAAREGVVVSATDSLVKGGVEEELAREANHVLVQHEDGTVATYAHLQPGGLMVKVGDRVRRRQPIGRSGNTGYSNTPHLHVEVYRVTRDFELQTLPVRFDVDEAGSLALEAGREYRAPFR